MNLCGFVDDVCIDVNSKCDAVRVWQVHGEIADASAETIEVEVRCRQLLCVRSFEDVVEDAKEVLRVLVWVDFRELDDRVQVRVSKHITSYRSKYVDYRTRNFFFFFFLKEAQGLL